MMNTYLVTWQVNVDSDSDNPLDVAADALGIQRAPGSTATVFTVTDQGTGQQWQVDLDEETVDELPSPADAVPFTITRDEMLSTRVDEL